MSSSCDDLAQQIATLNTLVGRLNNLSEPKVRQIVNEIVNPQINEVTIHLEAASTDARTANKTANTALQKVNSFQPGNYATIADLRLQRNAIDTEIQQFRQNIANGLATKAEKSAVEAYDAAMRADIQRVENAAARAESSARNSKSSASSALEDAVASAKAKEIAELKAKVAGDSAASSKNYAEVSAGAKETSVKASLTAEEQAAIALRNANNALNNANSSEASANAAKAYRDTVAKDASLVEGLIDKTRTFVGDAANSASKSAKSALDANAAVDGAKGLVKGFSERMDGFGKALNALEGKIGAAIQTAANAVGISNEALAATGRLAGKIAGIFVLISQIFVIIEQTANLNILGERIDAVERGLEFLGNSVSGILGKLLGLQNRIARNEATIVDVKAIAVDARLIGEGAARIAGDAQIHADRAQTTADNALSKATQAQTTSDGAVRNAAIANSNATTAYQKATVAEGIGQKALRTAGDAFGKGVEALGVATTALSLYYLLKNRPGIPGLPGRDGAPGRQGERGLQGIPGRDSVTTVVQIPGVPGRDGAPGRQGNPGIPGVRGQRGLQGAPGIPGRNGRDVNPADLAGLRALIVQQHAQTRTVVNATTTGVFGRLQTIIATGNAALTALVTAIATNTYIEKAMQLLTLAATLHNAAMLSNNLAQTLGTIINQCVGLILPKGINGTPINITEVLGHAIEDLVKEAIGTDNYTTITTDWAKANRIYQAGSNVFNQISNAIGILTSGLEMIGGNIGKIGNALKIWGVVGQHAYAFMNPQPNMKGKFFDFINTASAEANTIQMMVAIPVAFSAAAIAVNESTDAFTKALDQTDPVDIHGNPIHNADGSVKKYEPGLTVPDPTKTILAQEQAKADSTNIVEATIDDIFNGND